VTESFRKELEGLLSEPIEHVRERERTEFDRQLSDAGGRLVLFGAGNFGKKVLACLRKAGIEPIAFSDNGPNKWGTEVEGLPVLEPAAAAKKHGKSALFIVSIWSLGHSYKQSLAKLQALGCTRVTCSSSLRWRFADQLLPDYCQDLPHKAYETSAAILNAASLWSDELSAREYVNQIRWRTLGELASIGDPVREESYFLDSLFKLCKGEVFLDCGAYDGDTIQQVLARCEDFGRILAIEADPHNYKRLTQFAAALNPTIRDKVELLNVAVANSPGQLMFRATGGEGAHLSTEGDVAVECVRIDDLLGDGSASFIKMDIEGAELDALHGAAQTIARHRPLLSICVYHRQSDLWTIPAYIASIAPEYKFFLRPHDVDGWQLVCYAVPPERLRA
jgi:FkbM family methyltransferase